MGESRQDQGREPVIYTVGHSTHGPERFLELLRGAGITAIADVRSVPFSRHAPHFNRDDLRERLHRAGIAYVFLGRELGARPDDPECFRDGVADWDRLASSELFLAGLDRVLQGAGRFTIALLCAEREPLDCHRNLLVARRLQALGARIRHVLADGSIEDNAVTERRLLALTGEVQIDLFSATPGVDPLAEAYARRGRQVAWREPDADEGAL